MISAIIQLLNRLADLVNGIARQNKIQKRKDEAEKIKANPADAWHNEFGVRDSDGGSDKPDDSTSSPE